ncbi:hypothetical protein CDAR_61181 [Caerostris darwini]|uniref:Uncharacterized protein n=1 Tax=Caerostris darwini TaxID=1538125 RepID=A0AAV4V2K3_9ARAC|nr:hypothetical protein CDAR_61181 [Caerostris darwini]
MHSSEVKKICQPIYHNAHSSSMGTTHLSNITKTDEKRGAPSEYRISSGFNIDDCAMSRWMRVPLVMGVVMTGAYSILCGCLTNPIVRLQKMHIIVVKKICQPIYHNAHPSSMGTTHLSNITKTEGKRGAPSEYRISSGFNIDDCAMSRWMRVPLVMGVVMTGAYSILCGCLVLNE